MQYSAAAAAAVVGLYGGGARSHPTGSGRIGQGATKSSAVATAVSSVTRHDVKQCLESVAFHKIALYGLWWCALEPSWCLAKALGWAPHPLWWGWACGKAVVQCMWCQLVHGPPPRCVWRVVAPRGGPGGPAPVPPRSAPHEWGLLQG